METEYDLGAKMIESLSKEKIQAGAAGTGTGMGNARANDGHSATDLGVKVETLSRSDRSWNGDLCPSSTVSKPK